MKKLDVISKYINTQTPTDLQIFMNDNIKYGFVGRNGRKYYCDDTDWDRDWFNECIVQSGDELLNTLCGTCWDQVELERKWFSEHNYKFKTVFIWFGIEEPNNYPTHTFLAFFENNKWYWFENAFHDYRGIHEYNDFETLVDDVISKHLQSTIDSGVAKPEDKKLIKSYKYQKPKTSLNVKEYISHVVGR